MTDKIKTYIGTNTAVSITVFIVLSGAILTATGFYFDLRNEVNLNKQSIVNVDQKYEKTIIEMQKDLDTLTQLYVDKLSYSP